MQADDRDTYDLAVVFDDIVRDFDAATAELRRLCERLGAALRRMDLVYLRPSTLLCRLGFEPRFVSETRIAERLSVAQTRHFRVLDLMTIGPNESSDVFERQASEAKWSRIPTTDLDADLESLREALGARLAGVDRQSNDRTSLALPVRFQGDHLDGVGLAKEISTTGMYIESDELPRTGMTLTLALAPLRQTDLTIMEATVVRRLDHDEARQQGRVPGFTVRLALTTEERRLFDSFLVTALTGRPWPEQSGRRYERFPIQLPAQLKAGHEIIEGETLNVSRGGAYLITDRLVAPGAQLALVLGSSDRSVWAEFPVKVVHVVGKSAASRTGIEPGIGVEFTEGADQISRKLARAMGTQGLPPVYRALVVDDDRFYASLLTSTLRRNAYDVRYASSGERALKVLTEELFRFDVVILDLHLPGLSGRALIDWLKKIDACSDLAVVMVTAAGSEEDTLAELRSLGADDVITKAVSAETIVRSIDQLLEKRRR